MNEQIYKDFALEKNIKIQFGLAIEVDSVIAREFSVSRTAEATLFLSKKKQLFLYIDAHSKLLLSDVRKIVNHIGLQADSYVPPYKRPNYFDEVGTAKFREIFPGRSHITAQDIAFYRTLAPYHPALILISEVKSGIIFQYDSDSADRWRLCTKFTYRRIKTS